MDPLGEAAKASCGYVRIETLFTGLEPALSQLGLIMSSPNTLEVSVDLVAFVVRDVEVVEPPAQGFATTGAIEGSLHALIFEPLETQCRDVIDVAVPISALVREPLGVHPGLVSLEVCHQLHC